MPTEHWKLVSDGVYQRRYEPLDVSIGLILGPQGATLIDTRNNPQEAQEILDEVAARFGVPVVAVINTHAHYDHTFGNQVFRAAGIPIYGHHLIPRHFDMYERPRLERVIAQPEIEPDKSWQDVILTPPDVLVESPCLIQLGGRQIQLVPLGPGHTDNDLAIHIPDAGVWFLGDIIEESGPPMFGSGSHPLGWPLVLQSVLERISAWDTIIPGHGNPVNRDFVVQQLKSFELLAQEIRSAYEQSLPVGQIPFSQSLRQLWPEGFLDEAAKDAYAQLNT